MASTFVQLLPNNLNSKCPCQVVKFGTVECKITTNSQDTKSMLDFSYSLISDILSKPDLCNLLCSIKQHMILLHDLFRERNIYYNIVKPEFFYNQSLEEHCCLQVKAESPTWVDHVASPGGTVESSSQWCAGSLWVVGPVYAAYACLAPVSNRQHCARYHRQKHGEVLPRSSHTSSITGSAMLFFYFLLLTPSN